MSEEVQAVATAIRRGVPQAVSALVNTADDAERTRIRGVVATLDALGAEAPTPAAALESLPAILLNLLPVGVAADIVGASDPITAEQATFMIEHASNVGWLIWGVTTVISGGALMIVLNAGYGTPLDLIYTFLWGLGLPTTAATLQNLTPASVATSIGLNVPKSS